MGAAEYEAKTALLDAIRDFAVASGVPTDNNDALLDAIQDAVMPVIVERIEASVPQYRWTDFEVANCDCTIGAWDLYIWSPQGEVVATIAHMDINHPLDGELAESKRERAQRIVDALNAYQG